MDPFRVVEEPGARAARRAQFARFHDDNQPQLVALLHALRGDRAHAYRAAQRAFVQAWRRWRTVQTLPDPAGWTRRRARRLRPPHRRGPRAAVQAHEPGWIAASARPMFDALSRLPEQQRAVVALLHVGGLTLEQVADDEHLPVESVTAQLASGYQALARVMGQTSLAPGNHATADPVRSWAAVELAELAHALSYRTDRRAVDQVFRHAIRHRVAVTAATAAAVSIGLGGALAVTQRAPRPYDVALPPASGTGTPSPFPYPGGAHAGPPPPVLGPLSVPGLLPVRQPTAGQDHSPVPTSSMSTLDAVDESTTRRAPGAAPHRDSAEPGHPAAASPGSTQVSTPDQPTATSIPQPSSAGRGARGQTERATSASRSTGDSNSGGRGGGRGGRHASGRSSGEVGYWSGSSSHSGGGRSGDNHSSSSHSSGGHSGGGHSGGGNSGSGHSGGGNSGSGRSGGGHSGGSGHGR
jgi:DNA-directed RNA polymerase specialized sigma24 family protein